MKKIISISTMLLSTMLMANSSDLIKEAKDMGLKPIPKEKSEIVKLINNPDNKLTKEKYIVGKKLYFDPRLSKSGLISCNTCHNLALGGVDGVPVATGHKWAKNPHNLNSPTVYNAVFEKKQFWDGRSPDLEDQAQGPIQATPEMAATKEHVKQVVNSIPEYKKAFERINKNPNYEPNIKDVADAIAVFERTLFTPSRYDEFLNGNEKALTEAEQKGLKTFIDKGCASCHNGIALGGEMQQFPLMGKYKYDDGKYHPKDNMIKVPTLRNILLTRPYMHNGRVETIDEAIEIMAENQLGMKLTKEEIESIKIFFNALTGTIPTVKYPELPVSTDKTPKPQD